MALSTIKRPMLQSYLFTKDFDNNSTSFTLKFAFEFRRLLISGERFGNNLILNFKKNGELKGTFIFNPSNDNAYYSKLCYLSEPAYGEYEVEVSWSTSWSQNKGTLNFIGLNY